MIGRTLSEQPGQAMERVIGMQAASHFDCKAFSGELTNDGEHAEGPGIEHAITNEPRDQMWPGYSVQIRTHNPSFRHNRTCSGWHDGTLSPSRREIRQTRL